MTLPLSLAVWVLAPLVEAMVKGRRVASAALEGLVFVALGGMVLVHILPHSLSLAGPGALAVATLGLGLALGLARRLPSIAGLVLAVAGLAVHATLEGRALSLHGTGGEPLALLAVVLHRLPLGMGLWWLVRPVAGPLGATAVLGSVALLGAAGLGWGDSVLGPDSLRAAALFQAFSAGAFLPALFRGGRPGPPLEAPSQRLASGLGALAAVAMLLLISRAHPMLGTQPGELGAGTTFLHLSLETAPALLAAYVLTGLFQAFLGEASLGWLKRGSSLSQALRGTIVGLPLALCSCGVLPVYRGLIRKGVPVAAALSFLVAAPEIGVSAFLVSVPLIGWPLTLARLGGAFVVALLSGVLVSRLLPAPIDSSSPASSTPAPSLPLRQRLALGLREGLVESVDHTAPWILVGLGMAALVEPLLSAEWLSRLPPGVDVPLFALLGVPSFVCASGATPLVAVLLHKGLSSGAALAFLITGPATNVTTFAVMARLHGRKVTLAFGAVVALTSIFLGFALNALLPPQAGLAHEPHADHEGLLEWVGLVLLGALFLASLLRQGARGFLIQLLPGTDSGEGAAPTGDKLSELHVHGPSCGHDHGHAPPAPGARGSFIRLPQAHVHGPGCSHEHEARAPLLVLPSPHVHGPECRDGASCSHRAPLE
ncbi:permease [Archangium lipolyticum]|uniref:permease n=1 Tax=Archangium lipolyticum TaxID=2970465 RepID=UPI002149DA67|nr:permease [Archangium lipolyticum]